MKNEINALKPHSLSILHTQRADLSKKNKGSAQIMMEK